MQRHPQHWLGDNVGRKATETLRRSEELLVRARTIGRAMEERVGRLLGKEHAMSQDLHIPMGESQNLLITQHEFAQQALVENGLLKSLTEGLQRALAWEASEEAFARKLSTVRFIFQSFQRHLERLMRLEEVDGYMDSVLATNPHLSKAVDRLKEDHFRFRQVSGRLAQRLERVSTTDYEPFTEICDELGDILHELDEHSAQEAKLYLEGFEQEEGGEG